MIVEPPRLNGIRPPRRNGLDTRYRESVAADTAGLCDTSATKAYSLGGGLRRWQAERVLNGSDAPRPADELQSVVHARRAARAAERRQRSRTGPRVHERRANGVAPSPVPGQVRPHAPPLALGAAESTPTATPDRRAAPGCNRRERVKDGSDEYAEDGRGLDRARCLTCDRGGASGSGPQAEIGDPAVVACLGADLTGGGGGRPNRGRNHARGGAKAVDGCPAQRGPLLPAFPGVGGG